MSIISDIFAGGAEGVLGGIGKLAGDIRTAITGDISPEKKAEIQGKVMEIEFAAQKAQTDINLVEAKHPNIFVSGWRPFIGWVCGLGIAYHFIGYSLLQWAIQVWELSITPPPLETKGLLSLVFALLGLGGMRSWEKFKGVNSKH